MTDDALRTHRDEPLAALPEDHSSKAARILAAADALLLARGSRGFSVADVANEAHVGKGTVYLYWATKEDLLLGLIARDFIAVAEEAIAALRADPQLALPSRLCPYLLRVTSQRTLVKALQDNDAGLLGVLVTHPRSVVLRDALGPIALLNAVLPSWRKNGLARTDWDLSDQVLTLHALIAGFQLAVRQPMTPMTPTDPCSVMAAAVAALLGPELATSAQTQTAAEDICRFLQQGRSMALADISQPATAGDKHLSRTEPQRGH
ncbi:TetR/AcrR family transcriptional regulator [soil metagenome]